MNYLQLVNRARQECGVSGGDLTTLTGLTTNESKRFANWVQQAWTEVQAFREDWIFLRKDMVFTCVANTWDYDPTISPILAADFANFKIDSFRCSSVGANYTDEQILNFQPWDSFRDLYRMGPMRSTVMRPVVISVTPAKHLALGAVPDQGYIIAGEYFATPATLAVDADTPTVPSRFHMLIVYKAMMSYAAFESAPEVAARAQLGYNSLWPILLREQTPAMVSGPPLA